MSLKLVFSCENDATCQLIVSGQLDQQTLKEDYLRSISSQDKKAIEKSGDWCVDLAEVDRIDTAGLAWLINIAKQSAQNNISVSFDNVPEKLLNLADLSNARSVFEAKTKA